MHCLGAAFLFVVTPEEYDFQRLGSHCSPQPERPHKGY